MQAFIFTNFYSRGLRKRHFAALEWLQYSEGRDCSGLVGSWLLFSFPVQEWDYCLGRVKSISSIRIIYPWRCWASINSSWILLIHLNSNLCCLALRVQFVPFLIFSSPFPHAAQCIRESFHCHLSLGMCCHVKLIFNTWFLSISLRWRLLLILHKLYFLMLMKVWKNVKSDIDPFNMLFFKAIYKSWHLFQYLMSLYLNFYAIKFWPMLQINHL